MKIVLIGYGAMNQRVARLAESKGHEIIGVIVRDATKDYPYPTFER
ncbi:4-hydroxy-tetrahydrodipicolinate reductase, partial [Mammaliicoccus fleurettii]